MRRYEDLACKRPCRGQQAATVQVSCASVSWSCNTRCRLTSTSRSWWWSSGATPARQVAVWNNPSRWRRGLKKRMLTSDGQYQHARDSSRQRRLGTAAQARQVNAAIDQERLPFAQHLADRDTGQCLGDKQQHATCNNKNRPPPTALAAALNPRTSPTAPRCCVQPGPCARPWRTPRSGRRHARFCAKFKALKLLFDRAMKMPSVWWLVNTICFVTS